MLRSGQRDIDKIDLRVAQQVIEFRMLRNVGEIDLLAGRPEIALDAAPVAGQTLRIARANG